MKEQIAQFKGSQENMCEACRIGLGYYNANLPDFTKNNLKYSKQWSLDTEAQIAAALQMPDVHTRRSVPAVSRARLMMLTDVCTAQWQTLDGL